MEKTCKACKNKTWKCCKLHDLNLVYGYTYRQFRDQIDTYGPSDDRRVYVNMYERIIEAINSLPDEPVTYVKIAMWRAINKDKDALKDIQARFTD